MKFNHSKYLYSAYLLFIISILIFVISSSMIRTNIKSELALTFSSADSVKIDVYKNISDDSLLTDYYAHVLTPLCLDDECLPVEIILKWDVIGNYVAFDTVPNKPLTKSDHIPFSDDDYKKLHRILKNENPLFKGMKKEELVANTKTDAISGATIHSIKNDVIENAVFSCYVLWNIAHGEISDSIKVHTKQHLNNSLILEIFESDNLKAINYSLDNFTINNYLDYSDMILKTMADSRNYFAKHAMEKIPTELLLQEDFQDSLATIFPHLDYYTQLSWAEKLDNNLRSNLYAHTLVLGLKKYNSKLNSLIIHSLCSGANSIQEETFKHLEQTITDKGIELQKSEVKLIQNTIRKKKKLTKQ